MTQENTQAGILSVVAGSAGFRRCAMHGTISHGIFKGEIFECEKPAVAEYFERCAKGYRPVCSYHAKMLMRRGGVDVRPLPNNPGQK